MAGLLLFTACSDRGRDGDTAPTRDAGSVVTAARTTPAPATVVDSLLPPEEELRRFRVGLTQPVALSGGTDSRDALVLTFVDALERQDTATLAGLLIDRAEFAWLYYPHTIYTRPPYRMSPSLLWFLGRQESEKGITRALRRMGGRDLGYRGYQCSETDVLEENTLWSGCTIEVEEPGAGARHRRLFGSIIERDGQFKLLSYASGM